MSACVVKASVQRRADEDLVDLLDEMDAEYGPPGAEHYAWARQALGVQRRAARPWTRAPRPRGEPATRGRPVVTGDPDDLRAIDGDLVLLAPG